ncbi:hypothetical protein [Massilia sp. YIM B04103]|uniref:hypothetical protein n=1 Tax=Massilia sp. YIM B04103 TaxID=2963106 RepID=UPI002108953A|nr:hypothetical protein [Massilia sp. YIM B04103]
MDETDTVAGHAVLAQLVQARFAYHPLLPQAVAGLDRALTQLYRHGYDAFFSGAMAMPELLVADRMAAGMWMSGYQCARCDAASIACCCGCHRAAKAGMDQRCCRAAARRAAQALRAQRVAQLRTALYAPGQRCLPQ